MSRFLADYAIRHSLSSRSATERSSGRGRIPANLQATKKFPTDTIRQLGGAWVLYENTAGEYSKAQRHAFAATLGAPTRPRGMTTDGEMGT